MRKNDTIKCGVCGKETKVNGLATHFKSKHNLGINEYIEKYGEYRAKEKDYKRRQQKSNIECKICNQPLASERRLSYHLKKEHGISKREYIIQYLLGGQIPKCKCGCGEFVKIKERGKPPYWSDYISGHNTGETHVGMKRSYESRMRMRKAAINRMKSEKAVFYRKTSQSELDLRNFIESIWDGDVLYSDTNILSGLELDIYIPELKLAIELNGERFHSDLYKTKKYHLKKTKECNDLGIHLIHIWNSDWQNKQEIIKSQLKYKLGKVETKIWARQCEIREVSHQVAKQFLEENHLQSFSVSKHRYGLYYKNELMQIITFGKLRRATGRVHKNNSYELIRSCNKINTVVVGGVSKLFSHFIKKHNPEYILSFANRDFSDGNMYEKIGMQFYDYTDVGYFYSNGSRREHRYNFQKHKLVEMGFDENKTEYEIMSERGYYRIWNTGNLIYEWVSGN